MSNRFFSRVIQAERADSTERTQALRLQVRAWRIVALLALTEPKYAKVQARWLMFVSVPFVDGKAVQSFIDEHEERARTSGIKAGVFQE
mgnify:FL=1